MRSASRAASPRPRRRGQLHPASPCAPRRRTNSSTRRDTPRSPGPRESPQSTTNAAVHRRSRGHRGPCVRATGSDRLPPLFRGCGHCRGGAGRSGWHELQASAGARSAGTSLLHRWKGSRATGAIAFHATRALRRSSRAPVARSSFRECKRASPSLGVGRPLQTTSRRPPVCDRLPPCSCICGRARATPTGAATP
jgi:hypothetical protein